MISKILLPEHALGKPTVEPIKREPSRTAPNSPPKTSPNGIPPNRRGTPPKRTQ